MKAVLDADAAFRGGTAVTAGLGAMIDGLHPNLRWDDEAVVITDLGNPDCHVDLAGRELRLVPSLFLRRATTFTDTAGPPVVFYPARGRGTVWLPRREAPAAVEQLVGTTRAALLTRLAVPSTTTELARETGSAAPMVSRHLTGLHRAGLLDRIRRRSVYYSRTPIGDQLIAASS